MHIKDIIMEQHGSNCIIALPDQSTEIIAKHQSLLDNNQYANDIRVLIYGYTEANAAAADAYNAIKSKICNQWLSQISREQIISTLIVMSTTLFAAIEYLPGEKLSAQALMDEWNNANPDQKVSINPDYLI